MPGAPAHSYLGGDGGDVVITDTEIYFIEYNGNRVTGWNEIPDSLEGHLKLFCTTTINFNKKGIYII